MNQHDRDLQAFLYPTTRRRRRGGSSSLLRVRVGWVVVFGAVVLITAWLCIDLIRQGISNGYYGN